MINSPLELANYDIGKGFWFILTIMTLITLIFYMLSIKYSYRFFSKSDNHQDGFDSEAEEKEILGGATEIVKAIIVVVLGYRGESRERQALSEINYTWIWDNKGAIITRLFIFYFIYIWSLVLTTRAVQIAPDGSILIMQYTKNAIFGFSMILFYIISNSIFDMISLHFTLYHLEKIKENGVSAKSLWYASRDVLLSIIFFLCSQVVSNIIWPLKTGVTINIADRPLSLAISLWPYVFVFDASDASSNYIPLLFPGQLLITGTVFFPTIMSALIITVTFFAAAALKYIKSRLSEDERKAIGIIVSVSPAKRPIYSFRCINSITVGVVTSILASIVTWMFGSLFRFFY